MIIILSKLPKLLINFNLYKLTQITPKKLNTIKYNFPRILIQSFILIIHKKPQ